ncbi:hypothetical protein CPter91_4044 [Collimonas pratensis]|uniref:Uncharacterized protein n=1 Tax=Collimonas pratensis TaxID=279113 RepID=A0A127Q8L7_9BURK|nr:hypothetical protein CPter91_4044 [Collimonas pratensis]
MTLSWHCASTQFKKFSSLKSYTNQMFFIPFGFIAEFSRHCPAYWTDNDKL